jgi:endonuclease/exonuclease/phosphatase family metal-dependent hydrolase
MNMRIIHSRTLSGNIWLSLLALLITACTQVTPPERPAPDNSAAKLVTSPTLELLTLNIAHGRKDSFNQLLVPNDTIVKNLDDIAELLKKVDADVVALQEADGPSAWSGYFNHVSYLAHMAEYPWDIYSAHVNGKRINYGTALLSKVPFKDTLSHDFPKSPPTLRKGFTLGEIEWQPDENKPAITVDVLSVHLDFSRKKVREQQISDILRVLDSRSNPVIILGDFNSNWQTTDSVIRVLSKCSNARVFEPHSINHGTYKQGKHRLDWALLSEDLEFKQYQVLPDIVSDHRAILVEVTYIGSDQQNVNRNNSTQGQCKDLFDSAD